MRLPRMLHWLTTYLHEQSVCVHLKRYGRYMVSHMVALLLAVPCNHTVTFACDVGRWLRTRELWDQRHEGIPRTDPVWERRPQLPSLEQLAADAADYALKYATKSEAVQGSRALIAAATMLRRRMHLMTPEQQAGIESEHLPIQDVLDQLRHPFAAFADASASAWAPQPPTAAQQTFSAPAAALLLMRGTDAHESHQFRAIDYRMFSQHVQSQLKRADPELRPRDTQLRLVRTMASVGAGGSPRGEGQLPAASTIASDVPDPGPSGSVQQQEQPAVAPARYRSSSYLKDYLYRGEALRELSPMMMAMLFYKPVCDPVVRPADGVDDPQVLERYAVFALANFAAYSCDDMLDLSNGAWAAYQRCFAQPADGQSLHVRIACRMLDHVDGLARVRMRAEERRQLQAEAEGTAEDAAEEALLEGVPVEGMDDLEAEPQDDEEPDVRRSAAPAAELWQGCALSETERAGLLQRVVHGGLGGGLTTEATTVVAQIPRANPTPEDTARLWNLSDDQQQAFMLYAQLLLAEAAGVRQPPVCSVLTGKAGSGKSRVLQALLWFAYQHRCESLIALVSYTWRAALHLPQPRHVPLYSGAAEESLRRLLAPGAGDGGAMERQIRQLEHPEGSMNLMGRELWNMVPFAFVLTHQHRQQAGVGDNNEPLFMLAEKFGGVQEISQADLDTACEQLNARVWRPPKPGIDPVPQPFAVVQRHVVRVPLALQLVQLHALAQRQQLLLWRSADLSPDGSSLPISHVHQLEALGGADDDSGVPAVCAFFAGIRYVFTSNEHVRLYHINNNSATGTGIVLHLNEPPLPDASIAPVHVLKFVPSAVMI
ncbi:hypothetical protein CHLRE_37g759897v5 [Chlamydomonas reinhardtii]|uniref:Uncharacterized protein n=1 Tax=Chlamydomonas reinhardtii TaxID=3055 RepID=A0A2K3CMV2_CHLRE|nr:uncharacterized protein CHLRE_37g759897v5 [Chlamydomonas reinhardtii]PNW69608.1 hypothetical protein CHLRE_37g759897v5 [Chlamydomonas reinhardtii]